MMSSAHSDVVAAAAATHIRVIGGISQNQSMIRREKEERASDSRKLQRNANRGRITQVIGAACKPRSAHAQIQEKLHTRAPKRESAPNPARRGAACHASQ